MQAHQSISRRVWLQQSAVGMTAALAMKPTSLLRGDEKAADLQAGKLIVRQEKPFNAEPPLPALLDHWLTDNETFFHRSHGSVPAVDVENYRLTVEGLVDRPLSLSLAELKSMFPTVTATATITCAGNRRREFPPEKKIGGVQWDAGAIGNAEWGGVALAEVLKHAGVKPEAKHVWFDGLDEITEKDHTFSFGASIPLEKALSASRFTPGALLAHTMNRQPLPKDHGAPLRGIVPGYIGARSVKWLGKITISDRPSPNHYVADVYKLVTKGTPEEVEATSPIYTHALNSVSCRWKLDSTKTCLTVSGFALPSGQVDGLIQRVECSLDDGRTWTTARLISPQREFCWAFWDVTFPASAVGKSLLVKATDSHGEIQPREMPYNLKGYQYNGWHQVSLNV